MLRWSSETLLLSVRSLDRLQDIISTGNVGLMRGIHTLGIFMPTQLGRVREFVTLLDGWLVWSGSADDLKAKLDLAASGYAIVAPAMISVMAADQHRLTLLDTLTEAHLSLLPLLADGLTDEEIANTRGATLPTTKLLVRQLLARLQCRNRTEAAIFAWRHAAVLAQRRRFCGPMMMRLRHWRERRLMPAGGGGWESNPPHAVGVPLVLKTKGATRPLSPPVRRFGSQVYSACRLFDAISNTSGDRSGALTIRSNWARISSCRCSSYFRQRANSLTMRDATCGFSRLRVRT